MKIDKATIIPSIDEPNNVEEIDILITQLLGPIGNVIKVPHNNPRPFERLRVDFTLRPKNVFSHKYVYVKKREFNVALPL